MLNTLHFSHKKNQPKGWSVRNARPSNDGIPYGIRTRVAAVKGRCPKPLDERDTFVVVIVYKTI